MKILLPRHGQTDIHLNEEWCFMKYPLVNIVDTDVIKGLKNCEVIEFNI